MVNNSRLSIAILPNQIHPNTIETFEAAFNVQIVLQGLTNTPPILQNHQEPGRIADVLVLPGRSIPHLIAEKRILRLDQGLLPNLKNLSSSFLHHRVIDPGTRYSLPKEWGTFGYMYRPSCGSLRRSIRAGFRPLTFRARILGQR
jgi:spermidine/putrescine-binding protein